MKKSVYSAKKSHDQKLHEIKNLHNKKYEQNKILSMQNSRLQNKLINKIEMINILAEENEELLLESQLRIIEEEELTPIIQRERDSRNCKV